MCMVTFRSNVVMSANCSWNSWELDLLARSSFIKDSPLFTFPFSLFPLPF